MIPTIRFQRVMAAVLACALCGAIALFRERGRAMAQPPTREPRAIFDPSVLQQDAPTIPTTSDSTSITAPAKEGRTPTAAEAISQLAKSVVTIAKIEPGTKDRNVPDARIQAGVVIDPRGYVLTLWLDDRMEKDKEKKEEQKFVVRFSNQNQEEYAAEVVENDSSWNMAVLKIEAALPLPAVSLKNLRQLYSNTAVLLVPSVPRKKPIKGWITSPRTDLYQPSPYCFVESNIRLPDGEAGSLLVTSHGDPIGILANQNDRHSHAIGWEAVLAFIDSDPTLLDVLGHLAPNPPPGMYHPDHSNDEPMDFARVQEPEPGEPISGADPRSPNRPEYSDPPTVTFGPPVPPGLEGLHDSRLTPPAAAFGPPVAPGSRHFRAVTDSPAEQKLIEQLQSRESAAAELVAKIRTLQASGPGERNQSAIEVAQRELKSQLGAAFDLKLQLEELQVKELQSRLSRLERQIGQRRALRDRIIARRAAQLVEESGLQWDTSGTSPQPPPTHSVVSERPTSTRVAAPAVVRKLKWRAGLLFDGMRAGIVGPADMLSELEELKRVEPVSAVDWLEILENLLKKTEKLHAAGQLTEDELLQIKAAYVQARLAPEGASSPPKAGNPRRARKGRASERTSIEGVPLRGPVMDVHLSGPKGMRVSVAGNEKDLGATAIYSIERPTGEIVHASVRLQSADGAKTSIGGRLDVYPINDANDNPATDLFLEDNVVAIQISEQDIHKVSDGVDVTKVAVMHSSISKPDMTVERIELKTFDSAKFPPGTDMIEEASKHGSVVAVLTLSQRIPAAVDPTPKPGGPVNTSLNRLKGTEDSSVEQPPSGKPVSVSRVFPLRFKLASEMVDDLRQILLGRDGQEAKPSADNQQVLVVAPRETMGRVQTFITVMDWPDKITRGSNFEYPRESVIRAARSFFYACAIEDDREAFSKLLSLHVLAELKGDTKSENFQKYIFGGAPDPEWEKTLCADWPGKNEAIRQFVREWNKYPLTRITETGGVAIGFGAKHFCSASFAGAPKDFYDIIIEPDRTRGEGDKTLYVFSSLPPWWKSEQRADEPKTADGDLEGVWEMVSPAGVPGEQLEDQRLRLVFADGWHATYRGTQRVAAFRLRVDTQQTPHRISLAGDRAMRGIYEIKDDGLRLSLAPETEALTTKFGTERPEFKRVTGKLAEEQLQALKNMAEQMMQPLQGANDDNEVVSPSAGLRISTEKSRATLEGKSDEDADLVLWIGQKQYKLNWTNWLRNGREFKAVVELSDKIKPNHGSFGSGLIYRVHVGDTESTSSIRIPTTGPMPSGQLSFREAGQVTRKDGVITFADLRSDDGTLVPVSISVETKR